MLERIIIQLLTLLAQWLYNKGLEKYKKNETKEQAEAEIDAKSKKVKEVSKEVFNGEPVTKEDRSKINSAIREFLRPTGDGGL